MVGLVAVSNVANADGAPTNTTISITAYKKGQSAGRTDDNGSDKAYHKTIALTTTHTGNQGLRWQYKKTGTSTTCDNTVSGFTYMGSGLSASRTLSSESDNTNFCFRVGHGSDYSETYYSYLHQNIAGIDRTKPNKPTGLDLGAAFDTGVSNTDNVTNLTTVSVSGCAEAGSTITVSVNGVG